MEAIELKNVKKEFKIRRRYNNAIKTFFDHKYDTCVAVNNINLKIQKGESVGFIGPNGAGKSTTIKMMTGILQPTEGEIKILGMNPYKERKKIVRKIGVVFGQRSQLWWDIPVIDSFNLLAKLYDVTEKELAKKLEFFNEYLSISKYWKKPVRQLSLGQKMRAEFVASLLHDPEIIFLDEPTIGLDIIAKNEIRNLVMKINEEKKATVILTSHDMIDIERISHRVVLINDGSILLDNSINEMKEAFGNIQTMNLILQEELNELSIPNCDIERMNSTTWQIRFDHNKTRVNEVINNLMKNYTIIDLSVAPPSIESIVQKLYYK